MTNDDVVLLIEEEGLTYAVTGYHEPDDPITLKLWDDASTAVLVFLQYLKEQTGKEIDL